MVATQQHEQGGPGRPRRPGRLRRVVVALAVVLACLPALAGLWWAGSVHLLLLVPAYLLGLPLYATAVIALVGGVRRLVGAVRARRGARARSRVPARPPGEGRRREPVRTPTP